MKGIILSISKALFLFFLLLPLTAFSQYAHVDEIVRTYPKSFSGTQGLADKINADFSEDDDKARAIFTWIALNISYDMSEFNSKNTIAYSFSTPEEKIRKELEFRAAIVKKTLRSGKAVCEGYASLFTNLCTLTGLESVIVPGTSRNHHSQIGKLPTARDHAWNVVKINGQWKLIDVTWAAGIVNSDGFQQIFNDAYFLTAPNRFFLNHYPDDPKWMFTNKSASEFASQAFYYPTYLKSNYKFNIEDGVIRLKKDLPLEFNVENLRSTDKVYYITSRDKVLDEVNVDENNNFLIFPSPKMSGYLTIFINQKPVVSYKIVKS